MKWARQWELVNYCSGHVTVDASVHFTQHILRSTPKTMHRVAAYKRRLARAGMFQWLARCSLFYSAVPSRPLRCAPSDNCRMKSHQNTWLWNQHDAHGILKPGTDHRKYRRHPVTSDVVTGCTGWRRADWHISNGHR